MAEIILVVLCLAVGAICAAVSLLAFWAAAMERAATGWTDTGLARWLALIAVAGLGGGILILVL